MSSAIYDAWGRGTVTQSTAEAFSALRDVLLRLKPRGVGFEELLRDVLEATTGRAFRLKKTGFQEAIDAVFADDEHRVVMEAKLYRETAGLERHLMATIAYCAAAERKPDLVIFAASVSIDPDFRSKVRKLERQNDLEIIFLDWSGEIPNLAVVLAAAVEVVPDFLKKIGQSDDARLAQAAIGRIRDEPRFAAESATLLDSLQPASSAFEIFRRESIRRHEQAMADRQSALKQYGQALCPLEQETICQTIDREAALDRLEETAQIPAPVRNAAHDGTHIRSSPIVVLGDEGVGKSWLVAQWWTMRHRDLAFVFIPSNRFRGGDVDVAKLLMESFKALLDPDRRKRDADDRWRARIESERFQNAAAGKIIIVVDGLNEAPLAAWGPILADLWREAVRLGAFLVVTCRPTFWRNSADLAQIDWPDPATFRLDGFDRQELAQALALHGRRVEDIPPRLLPRLSNPRIFALAMRLFKTLSREADLGVDRLLFNYWDQRRQDRVDLRDLDPERGFYEDLARHAAEFHKRRLASAREDNVDIAAQDVFFPDDELRQRFAGLQRYSDLTKDQIASLVGEIRDGQFFRSDPGMFAPSYLFQSSALGFALGLYLVQEAVRVHRTAKRANRREALREHFAVLLEPVMAFDQTADQLLAAITVACLEPSTPALVRQVLLEQFIGLQNRPELLQPEFEGLATHAPELFFAVIDAQLATTEPERIDTWLIGALRRAYRAESGLDLFRDWVVSPPTANKQRLPTAFEGMDRSYRREVVIARVAAGLPLTPLAGGLLNWALLAIMRSNDASRNVGLASRADRTTVDLSPLLERSPMVRVIRFNDADPEELETTIVRAAAEALQEADADRIRAAGLLLAVIASPTAMIEAERLCPGIAGVTDPMDDRPLAPVYLIADPDARPSDLEALWASLDDAPTAIVDPRHPLGEQRLVLAARRNPEIYVALAEASLVALSKRAEWRNFDEPFESLETLAMSAPSVFATSTGDETRFVESLLGLACEASFMDPADKPSRSGKDLLKTLDLVLEALFATRTADSYRHMLLAIPWSRLPGDHWPTRPHRWRPPLTTELVDTLVADGVERLQSGFDEEKIAGTNLLEAVGLHPIAGLSDSAVDVLAKLFLEEDQLPSSRQCALNIAAAADSEEFAWTIQRAGWVAAAETDRNVATAASRLLCSKLAGRIPVDELQRLVLPGTLTLAAEGVTEAELGALCDLILTSARAAVELSAKASTEPDGAARLEKDGYIFRMLPLEPRGASRLMAHRPDWAPACFELLKDEIAASPRNSLCESLGTSLAIATNAPIDVAADYVEGLIRRRTTPNRRLGVRILSAVLAVATAHPARRNDLLDLLVLSTNDDGGLARLATAACGFGTQGLAILESYIQSLLRSGRTKRIAYGLMLTGLLSHLSPTLRRAGSEGSHQGYLGSVHRSARWIERSNAVACHWAEERLITGALAAEHLALSVASRPLATAKPVSDNCSADSTPDRLFRHRLREKSDFDGGDGLFGAPKPPGWLFDRTDHESR
jgi:hypothetical protein